MVAEKLSCYACVYAYVIEGETTLRCGKNEVGCPTVGNRCRKFERYPGAPCAADDPIINYRRQRAMDQGSTLIELSEDEIYLGVLAGAQRRLEAERKKREQRHGANRDGEWQMDIEGCLGEQALSKYLGTYFKGNGTYDMADVWNYDVRTTRYHSGKLWLYKSDKDHHRYYLLTGSCGIYTVRGWVWGWARNNYPFDDSGGQKGRPAYWIPQYDLNPPMPLIIRPSEQDVNKTQRQPKGNHYDNKSRLEAAR